jgi:type IV secretory pathway TrbD component
MTWIKWALAVLGLIVLAVPFLGLQMATLTWTLVIVGLVIAALSLWSLNENASEDSYMRGTRERRYQS